MVNRLILESQAMVDEIVQDLVEMRSGELSALRKQMINFKQRTILLPKEPTKNGRPRMVPLNETSLRTVEKCCAEAPEDLVFWHRNNAQGTPEPYTTFRRFFERARVRAKLEDVRFHDLRHTFASWWVQKGGDLYALMDVLGHGSLAMVQRYAHLDSAAAHREMQKAFPHTFDTVGGPGGAQ